jgi:hypothetical protein
MKYYVASAFSMAMIAEEKIDSAVITAKKISMQMFQDAANNKNAYSIFGHIQTSELLGVDYNRENIVIDSSTVIYLAQYIGGRPEEGKILTKDELEENLLFLKIAIVIGG